MGGSTRLERYALDVVGLALSAVTLIASTRVDQPFRDLLGGIGASLIFAVGIDLFLAAQGHLLRRKHQRFFGRELVRLGARFVYPDFVMNESTAEVLQAHNQQLLYRRPRSRFSDATTHRIDIPRVVASNDIRALLEVSDILRAEKALRSVMQVDRRVMDDPDVSFVSFGLSSNDCTHLYLEVDTDPMFEIVPDGEGSEFLRMRDGTEFRSDASRQYGLVLRFSPDFESAPDRRWFLVAGLGPLGTTTAAKYLAKRWEALLGTFGSNDDFIAVVSTGIGSDDFPQEKFLDRRSRSHSSVKQRQ